MMGKFLQKLGVFLIFLSLALLIGSEVSAKINCGKVEALAERLEAMLPATRQGDPVDYSDPNMPVLHLEGRDYVALLQVPAYGVSLPVASDWSTNLTAGPCRFWGSAYDSSLILGGSHRAGQLDFCGRLDIGDKITITDMAGARFTYETVKIERSPNADAEKLLAGQWDLTLFVRDSASTNYILVRCLRCP